MTETLGSRVKLARATLEMSQRAFASTIGVSLGAVQSWERDRTSPNGTVLAAMCRLGLDGHWLITGEGRMWRPGLGDLSSKPEDDAVRESGFDDLAPLYQAQLEALKDTKLAELLLFGRLASPPYRSLVSQTLLKGPSKGMTADEIFQHLTKADISVSMAEIEADCRLLKMGGLIRSHGSGSKERYSIEGAFTYRAEHRMERLQTIWDSIQTISEDLSPKLLKADKSAYLANIFLHVKDGRATLGKLRESILEDVSAHQEDAGDVVQVVLGMMTEVDE